MWTPEISTGRGFWEFGVFRGFIKKNMDAGYKHLITYMLATVIYDLTAQFCDQWIDKRSRTHDQMVQAGRSGKQNIAEGYKQKSLKSYIKLVGVAQGSLEELQLDYEDFLRQRKLTQWVKDDPRVREFRAFRVVWVGENTLNTPNLPQDPEAAANLLITLCNLAGFLLAKQLAQLEQKFVEEGGYTENLFKRRLDKRGTYGKS